MSASAAAGHSPAQLSRESGCSAQTISNRVAAAGIRPGGAPQAAPALTCWPSPSSRTPPRGATWDACPAG